MEFNTRQKNVINSKAKYILCLAAAASGKTATLIARVEQLLSQGCNPEKMICFTFTNQAANEMKRRLGDKGDKMFIGTAHSFANKVCINADIDTTNDIAQENFDKIIEKAISIDKSFYPEVEYLFIDEFQDTDELQARFISKIGATYNYATGDERQFIYSFKGSSDEYLRNLALNPFVKVYNLTQNYRNPKNILKFAESFIHTLDLISSPSEAMIEEEGFIDKNSTFYDVCEELTWEENKNNFKDWTILCRTNKEITAVSEYLDLLEIPYVTIQKSELDLDELNTIMNQNKVKIMTIHMSKGSEFDNVIVVGAKKHNEDERRISYVAATRAKKNLFWCPTVRCKKNKFKRQSFSEKTNNMISF